jgi:hypothetical protein
MIDGAVAMSHANIIPIRATDIVSSRAGITASRAIGATDIVRSRLGPTRNRATAITTTIGVGRGKTMTDGEAITAGGVITTAIATK